MLDDRRALPTTVPDAESTEAFTPGAAIGRFLVLAKLGSGGMGVVYAAYDPDLDRKVAVKLLRGNRMLGATDRDRDRLTSEAQAMARLAHPNVVAVYELGFTDTAAFLVMEHVTGRTLRDWLDERARPWPEVVAMYAAAGQGLAAAHRARIVHRDFKPDNVLLDRDGRPRVADFGLAAEVAADGSPVTAGVVAGTRRYMAPEQLRGEACDERADQFAYCVAVWHAVHGSWPFAGDTSAAMLAAITAGRLAAPARRTPDWLRAALARGLAAAPEARWPALDDLLRVLGRDRSARRWWIGGGAAAAALGAAIWLVAQRGEAVDPCAGAGAASRFAGIWDGPRKAAVQGAFNATGAAYADDTWRRVAPRIDGYVADWSRMATEVCRATRVEGRQSDTLMDLRMRCLDERRSVLGAVIELWTRGMDVRTLEHGVSAARDLPPVAECANSRALSERAPLPADPIRARLVAAVRPKLDAVQALVLARRWADVKRRIDAVRTEAEATGWPQVRAEAALARGWALTVLQEPDAEASLLEAVRMAGAARDDRIAASALSGLVRYIGLVQDKAELALKIAEIADGAVLRYGNDIGQRGGLMLARGQVLWQHGQYAAARSALAEARADYAAAYGPDDPDTLSVVADVASVMAEMGDYAGALALHQEVLSKTTAQVGPEHITIAAMLRNVAFASDHAGDYGTAADYYRRSLEMHTRILGPGAVEVARCLRNLGGVETSRGRLADAQALLERALPIAERLLGPESGFVAYARLFLGDLRRKQGRYREALEQLHQADAINAKADHEDDGVADASEAFASVYAARNELADALDRARRALEVRSKVLGNGHPVTLHSLAEVASVLARMHRCAEARPLLDTAIAGLEKAQGTSQWGYQLALATLGECELAEGAAAQAAAHAERAVALARGAKEWPVGPGQHRWVVVRALWALGRRDDAIAAARTAERELAADADGTIDRAAVRAWLAAHAPSGKPAAQVGAP